MFQRINPYESYEGIQLKLKQSLFFFLLLGEWVKNLRHGKGKFINFEGVIYEGVWKQDLPNGFGTLIIPFDYYQNGNINKESNYNWLKVATKSLNDSY